MRVTIRADATRAIGAGHVMRCWALAEELESRGAHISWEGRIDVPWVRTRLAVQGWEVISPCEVDCEGTQRASADVVVVDSYSLEWRFREAHLEAGTQVVAIIDDFHAQPGPATLWVNPGPPITVWNLPPEEFLNGPEYLLIRSEVRNLRGSPSARRINPSIRPQLTMLLGGTDFAGLWTLAEGLGETLRDSFDLVVGPSKQTSQGVVTAMLAGSQLLQRAASSDLVISPAGVSSWEMLHVGAPLALLLTTENQRGNYEWMRSHNVAFGLGDTRTDLTAEALGELIVEALVGSRNRAVRGATLVDGQGSARVADAIVNSL